MIKRCYFRWTQHVDPKGFASSSPGMLVKSNSCGMDTWSNETLADQVRLHLKQLISFLQVLGPVTACCEPYGILQESGLGRCVSMFDDQYTCAMGPSCSNPDPQTKKSVSVSRGDLFMHSVGMCCCSLQGHYRARGSCDLKCVGLTWSVKIHVSNLIRTCFLDC